MAASRMNRQNNTATGFAHGRANDKNSHGRERTVAAISYMCNLLVNRRTPRMHKDAAGGIGANAVKQTFDHEVRLLSLGWAKFIMGENAGQGFTDTVGKVLYTV